MGGFEVVRTPWPRAAAVNQSGARSGVEMAGGGVGWLPHALVMRLRSAGQLGPLAISISKARRRHLHHQLALNLSNLPTTYFLRHREDSMSSHQDNLAPAFAPFFGMVSACNY
jgi:hypothetical protein